MLIFAIKDIFINFGCILTFAKFVEFLKRSMVRGGKNFLIFQPKDMLNHSLNLSESQPIYTYKSYGYKNNVPTFFANTNHFGS